MKNKYVIGDTSGFVSLATISDSNHEKAVNIANEIKEQGYQISVPSDVFTETTNVLGKKSDHATAIGTVNEILSSDSIHIVESNEVIRQDALKKFSKVPESVSFTDCMVMALADEFKTKLIFVFDKHFKLFGYKRVGID